MFWGELILEEVAGGVGELIFEKVAGGVFLRVFRRVSVAVELMKFACFFSDFQYFLLKLRISLFLGDPRR